MKRCLALFVNLLKVKPMLLYCYPYIYIYIYIYSAIPSKNNCLYVSNGCFNNKRHHHLPSETIVSITASLKFIPTETIAVVMHGRRMQFFIECILSHLIFYRRHRPSVSHRTLELFIIQPTKYIKNMIFNITAGVPMNNKYHCARKQLCKYYKYYVTKKKYSGDFFL